MLLVSMLQLNVAIIIFLLFEPTGILLMGSVLPPKYLRFPVKFILYIIHAYGIACLIITCIILGLIIFTYLFYVTLFYTTELRLGQPKFKYRCDQFLRDNPETLRHVYRSFQVLHKTSMKMLGPYLLFINGTIMGLCIFNNFVLIRFWKNLQTFEKLPFIGGNYLSLIFWTSLLEFGRILFSRGNKVISSWKGNKWKSSFENKVMAKFRVSCKPLLLSYGTQFVIRKGNLFLFYRGIMRGTFRALLTTK